MARGAAIQPAAARRGKSAPRPASAAPRAGAPPADDPSWSPDNGNGEITAHPPSPFDAKSLAFHDDGGAWDGVNKFRVHDGNARRVIPDLKVRGTVSQLGLPWTRYSNTVERAGRRNFGTASHWRHSWQYDLLPLAPEKGDPRPRLALVYPDGTQRSLVRTGVATYASEMGYAERATVGAGRIELETGNGSRLLFLIQRRADRSFRYNLSTLTDPHGEVTRLDYDTHGFLTKVTELGSGRSLALAYRQYVSTATDRSIVGRIKAPFPAAGQWVEIALDPAAQTKVWRYFRLRLHPSATPARVAEIQFFAPGSSTPLAGRVIGDLAGAAQAFDGSAGTFASGDTAALRYAGLDFGAAGSQVARIRVLVGTGAPFAECAFEGLATKPASVRVLTQVKSDDGRAVHYDYGTLRSRLDTVQDIGLVRVRYGDGTTAGYQYGYRLPEGYRPALVQARDPRYAGHAKTVRYDYYPLRPEGSIGEIHRERDPGTGKTLATRHSDLAKDPLKRTVSYGDQRQVVYRMTVKGERNVAARTDELGRTERWEFDGKKQVPTAHVRRNGTRVETQHDDRGRLVSHTQTPKNAPARKQAVQRDPQGRPAQQTDRHGRTTLVTRDTQGRVTRLDHHDGKSETRSYDARGRLVAVRGRDGATRTVAHNARGLPAAATDATGRTVRYAYNAHDQLVRVTDAAGRTTRFVRDEAGRVLRRINSDGTSRTYAYDALGRHLRTTDELGRTTSKELDHLGRMTKFTDPAGNVTSFDYAELPNGCGACSMSRKPTHIRLPSGQQIAHLFDAAGRLVARTVAQGNADSATTTFAYNNDDRLISKTDPKGRVTRYAYDEEGKLTSQTNHAGKTTRLDYDAFDNLSSVTAPDGRARRFAYDRLGRLVRETDAAGATTRYVYTAAGDLASLTDAKGNRYRFTYDDARRRTAMIYPDGTRERWTYDAAGQPATYATRAGQIKSVAYDGRGRPAKVTWSPAGAAPNVVFEYDAGNQLLALDNGVARLTYAYDRLGRMLTETTRLAATVAAVAPHTVTYAYGAFGQRASLTYPDQTKVSYGYNGLGQLATVSVNGAAPLATYGYDIDGRVTGVSRDNGVSTRYTYDTVGHLLSVSHQKGSTVLASAAYTLDTLGRRTAQTREDGLTERYSYDEVGQLTGVDYGLGAGANAKPARRVDYTYDALGNRERVKETVGRDTTITDYDSNRLNQYTRSTERGGPATSFAYDRNGNLTGVNGRGKAHDASYRYNAQNQLVAAEKNTTRIECYYDAKGRCVARKQYTATGSGQWSLNAADSRVLTYESWNLVAERRVDGTQVANYIHGPRLDELLATITPTNSHYLLQDGLGSTVAATNKTDAVIERYRYDAYGRPVVFSDKNEPKNDNPATCSHLFAGRIWLPSVELYDYRNRCYSTDAGRMLQIDPLRFAGGDSNIYRYVGNDPVGSIDPFGLQGWAISGSGSIPLGPLDPSSPLPPILQGAIIGGAGALAVVALAPIAVGGLTMVGFSGTTSSAIVTTGLGLAAVGGGINTGADIYANAVIGNWNAVQFDVGLLVGGTTVGVFGGGRFLADTVSGTPSSVPYSWNPFADNALKFNPSYPGGSLKLWLGSGPTPQSGGATAALGSAGAAQCLKSN